jgi:NAD-dependent dihydropyrimidine dehydrogenase PreA subunit
MSHASRPDLVIYCHCSYTNLVFDETRRIALATLAESGATFQAVPDLCAMAAQRDPRLATWFAKRPVLVVACYPRTVRWLLEYAGILTPSEGISVLNMRTEPSDAIREQLSSTKATSPQPVPDLQPRDTWVPWFPVLDYDRCSQCRQCLSFCPFGVYELEEKRVVVRHPTKCKNNCPACARICPQVAIVFPKVKDSPINGAEVTPDDVTRQRKSAVEGETDLHALLARRRVKAAAGRFARNLEIAEQTDSREEVK